MNDMKKIVAELEQSEEFEKFKKQNKNFYLCHCFTLIDDSNKLLWQIGYTNKKSDFVHTFVVGEGFVKDQGSEEIFKEPGTSVRELDLDKVEVTFDEILKKASLFQKDKYPMERPLKIVVILQHLDKGQIWNITFLTQTYKTLNMKFDAKSSELLEHSLKKLIESGK